MTRDEIITDALFLLGVLGEDDVLSDGQKTKGALALNRMVKAWEGQGIHLWTQTEMTVVLVASQATYTLSPQPLALTSARIRNTDNIDRPIRIDNRTQFMNISNKTSTGQINRIFYDKQLATNTLYVWPAPEDTTDTLQISYLRTIEDFDVSGDNPDFPTEWLDALVYNLAVRLAPAFGVSLQSKKANSDILMTAQSSLLEMQLWDTENTKVRIVPAQDNYD